MENESINNQILESQAIAEGNPQVRLTHYFEDYALSELTHSQRILSTPSVFAKSTLFYIQEIGNLTSLQSHTSQRKSLDSFLFVIVLSGSGTFTCDGLTYRAGVGDNLFIDCMRPYSHRSSDVDPWVLMWVHFNGPLLHQYYAYFARQTNSILFHSSHASEYRSILDQLMILAPQKKNDAELMVSHLLNRLLTLALTEKSSPSEDRISADSEKMELIRTYLDVNYQTKLSLDRIAGEFFISKYHMAREFKKAYGITVVNYIITKRITHAKGLLRFTDMHIEEIGQTCGIDDNSYFNKIFRKIEGITASEYRKKWKES